MKRLIIVTFFTCLLVPLCISFSQAATITFEDLVTNQTTGTPYASIIEQGYTVAATSWYLYAHQDGWGTNSGSSNGTKYIMVGSTAPSLRVTKNDDGLFGIASIDLSEHYNLTNLPHPDYVTYTATKFSFTGIKSDNTEINASFTMDGISDGTNGLADFETYLFGEEWSSLKALIVTPINDRDVWYADTYRYGGVDNIVVSASQVPIPPSVWLLGAGLAGLVGLRRKFFRK
jgi:hypothetical protein